MPTFPRQASAALLAALLAITPVAQAQVRLPALGESAQADFSVGAEHRLGLQIMSEIRRDPDYLDDPVLLEYVQSIFQPLVAAARQRGDIEPDVDRLFAWEPFLVRDRVINAFALPGGYVGINLGLIALTANSDELASVLGHELSHVTQRHIARSMVAGQHATMVGLAALIVGILAATRSNNADVANAAIMGSQALAVQGQINFTRDMEREADRMGYAVMGLAGFSQAGMAQMFDKLESANRLNDSGSFPYLRDHPLTSERIAEAQSRALFAGNQPSHPPLRHALMQIRARVLMDRDPAAMRRFEAQAAGDAGAPLRERLQSMYAGALAASLQRDHALALRSADAALALASAAPTPDPQALRLLELLQAQVRDAAGEPAAALAALDSITLDAATRAPLMLRAQAVLDRERQAGAGSTALRDSVESLQTWLAEHPNDASAWSLLSATADAAGLHLRSLRAGAEARAALGDLGGAIDRLRAAQTAARGVDGRDFIEASVVDARLRELQSQRRELENESRRGPGWAPAEAGFRR